MQAINRFVVLSVKIFIRLSTLDAFSSFLVERVLMCRKAFGVSGELKESLVSSV